MKLALALAVLLATTGCQSEFFTEHGTMTSTGTWRNTWQWYPQGCTRDPFDAQPMGQSKSIVTLLWENPGLRDVRLANKEHSPDAPLRLEFMPAPNAPGRVQATLHTINTGGILLDDKVCSTLKLTTQEHPAVRASGRPNLSGDLDLDCRANASHITAQISFERCEY